MEWELYAITDGHCLAFWDSLHGEDVVIVLRGDKAYWRKYEGDTEEEESIANLPEFLRCALSDWEDACNGPSPFLVSQGQSGGNK